MMRPRSGPISFRPTQGKIERKKDLLYKTLILLMKSSDLSDLSDLSGRTDKPPFLKP